MVQVPEDATNTDTVVDYKSKATDELIQELESRGLTYKKCDNENINRMRIIMVLKKQS